VETWKKVPIKQFSHYEVSNEGRVRKGKRILKSWTSTGYKKVILCNDGVRKSITVHRLVAMAFLKQGKNQIWINHKDCNKSNNKVENLEWCTPSENLKHSWANGRTVYTENMRRIARKQIFIEVEKQKKKVLCIDTNVIYESACEAARQINGSQPHISDCCNGKRIHHKGYKWKWV
jgi:hypothetical protein